jgi:hypothetical protein
VTSRPLPLTRARRRVVDVTGMAVAAALLAFVATRGEVVSWLWR